MKLLTYLIAFITAIIFSITTAYAATGSSAGVKLAQIEKDTYGSEQSGAILSRLNLIEKDYIDKNLQGSINDRIDALYDILYSNNDEPSVFAKVNALEWNINHEVMRGNIDTRLSQLENLLFGTISRASFNERIRILSIAAFGSKEIPLVEMPLPASTLIKAELIDAVDSRNLRVGTTVAFKVAEDVMVDGNLIFARGLRGEGRVIKVVKAKGLTGRNGKVVIDFDTLTCIDGRSIHVYVGDASKQAMKGSEMVDGAKLVGLDISSNLKKVFVHGKNVDLPANTKFYVETQSVTNIYGLQDYRGIIFLDEALKEREIDDADAESTDDESTDAEEDNEDADE